MRSVAASPEISSVVDDRLAPRLEVVADLLRRADQRQLLDQLASAPARRGLVLLAVEVEVLDLARPRPRSPCGSRTLAWKLRPSGAHAAEVQRVERAQRVGRRVDVVGDDQRHGRGDLEVVELRGARRRARSPRPARRGRSPACVGREQHRQPAVAQLGAQRDVLRALGAEVDRDVLAQRVDRGLQRLAEPGAVRAAAAGSARRRRVTRPLARPDVAQDADVLARARERLGERHARTSPRPPAGPRRRGRG